nr:reverse transcriptase domain-containing protein [Tanacetum cinerariifolium]
MAPVIRQGQNPPPPNTNTPPHHMTQESVQAMIDQAFLRNSTNGDGSQSSHEDNPRHVDLMDRENGIRFQHQWLCYRESGPEAYAMTWEVLKKKMTDKYYPQGELKKLKIELWNLKVKGNNIPTYTNRFQELTLMCTKFVANENEKIDKYISGLPDNIYGNVKSSKPRDGKEAPKGNGCFECGASGHFKRDCLKLKNKNEGNRNAQGWVYAVGNAEKNKNAPIDPDSNVVMVISCLKVQKYIAKGCQIFMAQISAKKEEVKSEGKQLKDVPIVRNFPEVFPEDLPGLPSARPVEFQIDLILGATPVA